MIFYHPDGDLKFSEYGIEIPIVDDRAARVFSNLKKIIPTLTYTDLTTLVPLSRLDLERAHHPDFVKKLFGSPDEIQREILSSYELINEEGLFERFNPTKQKRSFEDLLGIVLLQVAMTYTSTAHALETGFSYYLGGGMHHSMSFGGRGFCLVNDLVITLRKLQAEKKIKTAWIVDVDAHKGDGSAEILLNDPALKTFSIHMEKGWPLNGGNPESDPWFIPSSLDIGIPVGGERDYLALLEKGLLEMESKFSRPDIVLVVNGADPYAADELLSTELLKLSKEELLKRDQILYRFFKEKGIPQSYVMAGGYGEKSWEIYYQFLKFVGESSSHRTEVGPG